MVSQLGKLEKTDGFGTEIRGGIYVHINIYTHKYIYIQKYVYIYISVLMYNGLSCMLIQQACIWEQINLSRVQFRWSVSVFDRKDRF